MGGQRSEMERHTSSPSSSVFIASVGVSAFTPDVRDLWVRAVGYGDADGKVAGTAVVSLMGILRICTSGKLGVGETGIGISGSGKSFGRTVALTGIGMRGVGKPSGIGGSLWICVNRWVVSL